MSLAMLKQFLVFCFVVIAGCASIVPPDEFVYSEVKTSGFTLASWQKMTEPGSAVKIYIEGDGNAFDYKSQPTGNPTPKGYLTRNLAFNDPSPNVVYLARPCQFVQDAECTEQYWTTARFAPEVIRSTYEAVEGIAGNNEIILIGYSGGAQVAILLAEHYPDLSIRKIITIAGVLDHTAWTMHHGDPPLVESLNISSTLKVRQLHYAGSKDKVVPPALVWQVVSDESTVVIVPNATHTKGYETIFPLIWSEN